MSLFKSKAQKQAKAAPGSGQPRTPITLER